MADTTDETIIEHVSGEGSIQTEMVGQVKGGRRRLVVVEPVVMLITLFGFPLMIISQLYILDTIQLELTQRHGLENISHDANTTLDLCALNESDPLVTFNAEVQEYAAYFTMISTICSTVPAFFISLFLGAYSDKAGRKYAILPPLVAGMLRTVVYVVVVSLKLSLWYLLIGSVIDGLGGYYTSLLMGCFAYLSDTTTRETRRFRITLLEICFMLPGILGPLGAGKLLETIGFLYCFLMTLAGQAIVVLYVIFLVPETITRDPSARFLDTAHLRTVIKVFSSREPAGRNIRLTMLLAAFFISSVPMFDMSIDTLYVKNRPLCFSDEMVGYFTATYLGGAAIGAILSAWLLKYCMSDQMVAMMAGLVSVAKNIYKAFIQNAVMIFVTPVFGMFTILYIPTIRTLMSNMVTESEQGSVFGAIACVEVLCSVIGTAIFNPIYASSQELMTGFVYLTMAAFYLVGCLVLLVFIIRCREDKPLYKPLRQEVAETDDNYTNNSLEHSINS